MKQIILKVSKQTPYTVVIKVYFNVHKIVFQGHEPNLGVHKNSRDHRKNVKVFIIIVFEL